MRRSFCVKMKNTLLSAGQSTTPVTETLRGSQGVSVGVSGQRIQRMNSSRNSKSSAKCIVGKFKNIYPFVLAVSPISFYATFWTLSIEFPFLIIA